MKTKKFKFQASIIVINYNNEKYLLRSLNSLKQQLIKNYEVILVDNNSSDNSLKIANEFLKKKEIENFKILNNKYKTKFGSFNQMNCILSGLKVCKGELIFFLDSDDYFKKTKIKKVLKFFKKNKNLNLTFDLSYKFFNKNNKKKIEVKKRNKYLIPWPSFPSQSCLIIKRKYLKKIINKIIVKKYPNIWFDFRLVSKAFYDFGEIKYLKEHLTYYQQHHKSESIKFTKFSKN